MSGSEEVSKRPTNRAALRFAAATAGLAVAAYLLETFLAEDAWFSMLITYVPQWPFALLCLASLAWAIRKKCRRAIGWSVAGLALGIHLCGPCWRGISLGGDRDEQAKTLKVLTFNLQECHGGAERIAELLRKEEPDVACFQEARFLDEDSERARLIRYTLGGYHWYRYGNLAIASRWAFTKTWAADFKTPTHNWAIFAQFEWDDPYHPVVVAAVHLNPVHWDRFSSSEVGKLPEHLRTTGRIRVHQAEELIREAGKLDPGLPVILCGDFNGPPRGRVYDTITRHFSDSFAERGVGFGWTIPSGLPMMRLDYVFTNSKCGAARCRVLEDAGSDHLPLMAEVWVDDRSRAAGLSLVAPMSFLPLSSGQSYFAGRFKKAVREFGPKPPPTMDCGSAVTPTSSQPCAPAVLRSFSKFLLAFSFRSENALRALLSWASSGGSSWGTLEKSRVMLVRVICLYSQRGADFAGSAGLLPHA